MNNKLLLESMSLDLKRVALGAHSHSSKMAERFLQEVFKRKQLLDNSKFSESQIKMLNSMEKQLRIQNIKRLPDDALMYSTILLSFSKQI